MARKLRVEYAGAMYHIRSQGDRGELVYTEDSDRRRFREALGEVCVKMGWQVHEDVLMPSLFHREFETPQPNLVAGIKW